MRILHVLPAYFPAVRYGGPVFAVRSLCRELAALGHDVEVMATNMDGPGVSDVPVGRQVSLDGVTVRYFAAGAPRLLFRAPAMAAVLHREVASFDVVHLHTMYAWPTTVAAHQARRSRVPYVISPRGMLVRDLIRRRSRLAKTAWIGLFERRNIERAAGVHVTSGIEAAELGRFGWKLPVMTTIPNGVDDPGPPPSPEEVSADVRAAAAGGPFALCLGRLSWKKGLDRLLDAFALTRSGNLVIAGTDDENLAGRLLARAGELRIDSRVRILPRMVLAADKEYLFHAARLLVLPSYSENFGNVVVEAMRRGVPAVVTPEVGAAEIVCEARGGLVVEGAPEPLAATVGGLLEDPERAGSMGAAGRAYVIGRYGWPQIALRMQALYASVQAR